MCDECTLAPQNVPSATVLTLGNKVVLYLFCFCLYVTASSFFFYVDLWFRQHFKESKTGNGGTVAHFNVPFIAAGSHKMAFTNPD